MIAADQFSGSAWAAVSVIVFALVVAALAVDRVRLRRRLSALERSEALLETDLADTRRRLDELRTILRHPDGATATSSADPAAGGSLTG